MKILMSGMTRFVFIINRLPKKSEVAPNPLAAAAAKCPKCNPEWCNIAGTRCGLIGLDVVLSDGDGLGLSDFLLLPFFGAKILSIVNKDDELVLRDRFK
jgi:hypothetical protein